MGVGDVHLSFSLWNSITRFGNLFERWYIHIYVS